jgi:gliding motility-associated-like protein
LNFIPPLSCFFQESVYIPAINQIGTSTYSADLMILTYSTATITINGNPINTSQAQAVVGNTDWVTYRISGYTGNISVVSTGPVAVGVFGYGGNGNTAGYAGYYSGFGSTPQDTPVTVCSSSTTNLFNAISGNPGIGGTWAVPAGGTPLAGDVFNPAINIAGEYVYEFTKTCNTTPTPFYVSVFVTIQQANNVGASTTKNTCKNESPFDLFLLLGPSVTTGGTWSLNGVNRANSNFDPATDLSGTYTYTIPASGVCPALSSNVVVSNYDLPTLVPITDFKKCDDTSDGSDTNGQTSFNLTLKTTEIINSQVNVAVTYHLLPNEAIAGTNAITLYAGSNTIIYVRLFNTVTNCFNTTSFNVVVMSKPTVNPIITLKQCDSDTDAITDFNLTKANVLLTNLSNLTFKYFLTQADAQNNTGQIINDTAYNSPNNGIVWARIENANGCFRTAQVNLIVSATQIPATFQKIVLEECDDYISLIDPDNDGIDYFSFSSATNSFASATNKILALFANGSNLTVTYYTTEAQALAQANPIDTINPVSFRNTVPNLQNIWVRIDSNINNGCVGLGQYLDLKVNPLPNFDIIEYKLLCVQPGSGAGSFAIDATPTVPGNYTYSWTPTNPNTTGGQQNAIFNASASGIYKVVVTNTATLCSREDQTELFISSAPNSVKLVLVSEIFASGLATIQAKVIGGFGTYEFSLNQVDWQTSPVFTNLPNGVYTVYAKDVNGCPGVIPSNTVTTISYPNYFTPNGDTYNDTWNISGLSRAFEAKIYIFDRYGKLIKQINPYANGWDGKYNEQEMPSTDYWFKIEYKEDGVQKEFKSHFSLKR